MRARIVLFEGGFYYHSPERCIECGRKFSDKTPNSISNLDRIYG